MKIKRVIFPLIISAGLYSCATTSSDKNIENTIPKLNIEELKSLFPKDEAVKVVSIDFIDYNQNGEFDLYAISLNSEGKDLERNLNLVYNYSNGKISKFPISTTEEVNGTKIKENKEIKYTINIEKYDCGTEKINSKLNLPSWTEFKPDGKWDLETKIEMEFKEENNKPSEEKTIPKDDRKYLLNQGIIHLT